jgi:hypothetical protein
MRHLALPRFWRHYWQLPGDARKIADWSFELLKADPCRPILFGRQTSASLAITSAISSSVIPNRSCSTA